MKIINIFRMISTLGPIGSLPASGTVASFLTACVVYGCSLQQMPQFGFYVLCATLFFSVAIEIALPTFYSHDPRQIVADELIGYLVGSLFIEASLPAHLLFFGLFRFFDIKKPLGLRRLEFIRGVQGIVFDDIGAGFYAGIITTIVFAAYRYMVC